MYLIKRSNGIYYVEYTDDYGKTHRRSTSSSLKKEALIYLKNFSQQPSRRKEVGNDITLTRFHEEYRQFVTPIRSPKYVRQIQGAFDFLLSETKDIPIRKLTTKELEKSLIKKYGTAKYAAHNYYKTLRSAFNKAVEWRYLESNPLIGIKLPRKPVRHPLFINREQLEEILMHSNNQQDKDIFTLAFYTGMRLNEILHLEWSHVDFSRKLISVKVTKTFMTKNKKERIIPMHQKVEEILKRRAESVKYNLVFYKQNGLLLGSELISEHFRRTVRATSLDRRIHFHTLRHSFASNLVRKGISIYIVKELLGHEDISTTQIYSHLETGELGEILNFTL